MKFRFHNSNVKMKEDALKFWLITLVFVGVI